MSTNPTIAISFIRDLDNMRKDDKIVITKKSDDDFDVSIKFAGVAYGVSNTTCFEQTIPVSNLKKYVRSILVLTMHDAAPYVRIQVDMPNAPSVLLKINQHTCDSVYDAIDELIEVSVLSWPQRVNT